MAPWQDDRVKARVVTRPTIRSSSRRDLIDASPRSLIGRKMSLMTDETRGRIRSHRPSSRLLLCVEMIEAG